MKPSALVHGLICVVLLSGAINVQTSAREWVVAAAPQAASEPKDEKQLTPEEYMNRRYPQPIRIGDLVGLPVLDWRDSTIGFIADVVRTPEGKIQLIVPYRPWFGWLPSGRLFDWGRRPVAVPLELVVILGRQVAAFDMSREQFDAAPTFVASQAAPLGPDDRIRIAIGRR
jgi:hypothetical protein